MPRDLRMSRMLHVLIHMDRHVARATSEQISKMIATNPVVVRRMMAGLREKGVVTSEKGAWRRLAAGAVTGRYQPARCL